VGALSRRERETLQTPTQVDECECSKATDFDTTSTPVGVKGVTVASPHPFARGSSEFREGHTRGGPVSPHALGLQVEHLGAVDRRLRPRAALQLAQRRVEQQRHLCGFGLGLGLGSVGKLECRRGRSAGAAGGRDGVR
jgi:hypothetical protein